MKKSIISSDIAVISVSIGFILFTHLCFFPPLTIICLFHTSWMNVKTGSVCAVLTFCTYLWVYHLAITIYSLTPSLLIPYVTDFRMFESAILSISASIIHIVPTRFSWSTTFVRHSISFINSIIIVIITPYIVFLYRLHQRYSLDVAFGRPCPPDRHNIGPKVAHSGLVNEY